MPSNPTPPTPPASSTPLDRAQAALKAGRPLEAEEIVANAARQARDRHGADSVAFASAQFDLALVLCRIGDLPRAAQALRLACAVQGDEAHTRDHLTHLMNLGEVLTRLGELDEAEEALRAGLAARDMLGRALVARGIFLQHEARLEEAQRDLEEALALLPPSHADALCGASHLQAISDHKSCGCGNMNVAIAGALESLVRPHLPDGLLERIDYTPGEGAEGSDVSIQLAREPSEAELELMNRVVQQALVSLKKQLRRDAGG